MPATWLTRRMPSTMRSRPLILQRRRPIPTHWKSNLSSAISQAQGTLDNSAGSVADENTRTALQNAITEANTVMNGTSPSESDVNNAISRLQKAESDVTASMQAKQQADAAKASSGRGSAEGRPRGTAEVSRQVQQ